MTAIKEEGIRTDMPEFRSGDTVRIYVKVVEGSNERIQIFDGTVIARRGKGISETFTVRKISFGIGVERIFPVNSPRIEKIEVLKHGKVRRSKLYYLRELYGKAAKLQDKKAKIKNKKVTEQKTQAHDLTQTAVSADTEKTADETAVKSDETVPKEETAST